MTGQKHFAVFDANSHIVESPEIWEKYLEPEKMEILGNKCIAL